MANRLSMFSVASESPAGRNGGQQTTQVSTTTLLNGIHNIYLASLPFELDSSTSIVVNTWLTAAQGGPTVDAALSSRAWEHARRRAEDGLIILGLVFFFQGTLIQLLTLPDRCMPQLPLS